MAVSRDSWKKTVKLEAEKLVAELELAAEGFHKAWSIRQIVNKAIDLENSDLNL
jgi:hypothetical protein